MAALGQPLLRYSGLAGRYSGGSANVHAAAVSQTVTAADQRMCMLQRSRRPLQRRICECSCCSGLADRYSGGSANVHAAAVSRTVTAAD